VFPLAGFPPPESNAFTLNAVRSTHKAEGEISISKVDNMILNLLQFFLFHHYVKVLVLDGIIFPW